MENVHSTGVCENCGEEVMQLVVPSEVWHIEPYDTEYPTRCDPKKVK